MAKHLKSIEDVIEELGGNQAVVELTQRQAINAPSMWKRRGRFPPTTYSVLQAELRKLGKTAPDKLWGMT